MQSTISYLKENLNRIALDVHEDDDDEDKLGVYGRPNKENSAFSDRQNSHSFAHSNSGPRPPVANGAESAYISEMEQYKAEIKRLQASEAEIKGLSVNYAALLKEKEDQIIRLNEENGSLKQNLEATSTALSTTRTEVHRLSTNGTNTVKELADLVGGGNNTTATTQHTSEMLKLTMELELESDKLADVQLQFQEEQKLNKSFQEELKSLRMEKDETSKMMNKIHDELNEKVSEIKRLQVELKRQEDEEGNAVDSLKRLIKALEKENTTLRMEKNELDAALKTSRKSFSSKVTSDDSQIQNKDSNNVNDKLDPSKSVTGKEEMEQSLQKLSKDLKETQFERDKLLQELTRLKQHLLEKESEESEKMDEDSKIIEELRESNNYLRAQISHFEKTLKQAITNQEELKMANNNEVHKSKEIIDDLHKKLTNCMSTIDAKNVELLNLQTALGQYYAEIDAKEYLEDELVRAREESAKLARLLKDADYRADILRGEREEILAKLLQSETAQSEWRSRVSKLEEDNAKLRRAAQKSMTQLNRMSMDSDYLVDRRIVIKLLITYFHKNHNKEVLDLMVRMLGFSDEDKQRIGVAQQGTGKHVRGVLGLPGRLVGGIWGSSTKAAANVASDSQSFADLWVDFLLKQTEREKSESAGITGYSAEDLHDKSSNTISAVPPLSNKRLSTIPASSSLSINASPNPNFSPHPHGYFQNSEHFDSEFSTIPLTSSDSKYSSNLLPKD